MLEVTHKLLDRDIKVAYSDADSMKRFEALRKLYEAHVTIDDEGDFSERIMHLVNRIVASFAARSGNTLQSRDITDLIYGGDINPLQQAVVDYLGDNTPVWFLFDNIDKGWSSQGTSKGDIVVLRCLLEATRKFERTLTKRDIACHTILFIRKDVYDLPGEHVPAIVEG